jgi:two-component system sensor histidine kinase/response regulator
MEESTTDREKIVVIDDDYAMRLSCRQILSKSGFQVETFEDGLQGLDGIPQLRPDLAVVDLKMPGISGIEVIRRIHETDPTIVVVVITGYATIATAVDAMKAGAYDFLPKPFKPDELRLIVRRGLERRRLQMTARRAEMERELLKRRFVTFVSHQLKSPLVAIHQYLDVLKRLGDSEDARAKRVEWLDRCLKRSEELQGIITDWLTLAQMEGETLSRQRVGVDLNDIIPGTVKTYEEMAAADNISLGVTIPDEDCVVLGDRSCLAVLFDNLIVNAIKYNKPGGTVSVTAERVDGEVVVSVADTGVGIRPEYRERLFDEFFRVKDSRIKKTTGTGLGLPICKRIVSEHEGSIEVESEPDIGSTFRVRLPAYRELEQNDAPEELE